MIPVFDGHNDLLLRMLQDPTQREAIVLAGDGKGHLDLPRMKAAGFAGGFFAIYLPSPITHDDPDHQRRMRNSKGSCLRLTSNPGHNGHLE